MTETDGEFSKDLLRGAEAIAEYLFADRKLARRVYHLTATSNLPHFKLGAMICARKSVLIKWVTDQEGRHSGETRKRA
ncbi:MAG: DNA-binding protein [Xanthobacteraceae bacterium]